MVPFKLLSPSQYVPGSYTSLTIPQGLDTPKRDVGTTRYKTGIVGGLWQVMCTHLYANVAQCRFHKCNCWVVPAEGPLKFFGHWYVWTATEDRTGNQHVFVITRGFSTLKRASPAAKINLAQITKTLFNNLVRTYEILSYVLTHHGRQFVSKCFTTLSLFRE